MPVGYKDDNVTFNDISYDRVTNSDVLKGGTGILTDGKFGPDDAKQDKGKGWMGWSSSSMNSSHINITFEFSSVRKFKDVTLIVNVDRERDFTVFKELQIFLASSKERLPYSSNFKYCPKEFSDDDLRYKRMISLPLCENTARFIKLSLYVGESWLLITEITFNSGILALSLKQIPFYDKM